MNKKWTNEWFSFIDNDDECFMLARHVETGETGVFVFRTEHGAALQARLWYGKRKNGRAFAFKSNVRHNGRKTLVSPGHVVLGVAPDVKVKRIEKDTGFINYTPENLAVTDIGPQEWVVEGDVAWIVVDSLGKKVRFVIDAEDVGRASGYRWRDGGKGYLRTIVDGKEVFLHNLIMEPPDGLYVDHMDGDVGNNQKSNLRIVSGAENQRNRRSLRRNRTGIVGVIMPRNRFLAQVKKDGKNTPLGSFKCIHQAADARRAAHIALSPDAPEPASDPYKMAQAIKKLRLCGCERCSATVRDYGGDI